MRHRLLRDSARSSTPNAIWRRTLASRCYFVNPTPIKGVEILFALAAACPELPFLVYESWNLAPAWREHCQQRARALGNVCWQAPTLDMRQAYAQACALLMPSIWEESLAAR